MRNGSTFKATVWTTLMPVRPLTKRDGVPRCENGVPRCENGVPRCENGVPRCENGELQDGVSTESQDGVGEQSTWISERKISWPAPGNRALLRMGQIRRDFEENNKDRRGLEEKGPWSTRADSAPNDWAR